MPELGVPVSPLSSQIFGRSVNPIQGCNGWQGPQGLGLAYILGFNMLLLIRNNRSKNFGVEYWALPGSNSPWRPCYSNLGGQIMPTSAVTNGTSNFFHLPAAYKTLRRVSVANFSMYLNKILQLISILSTEAQFAFRLSS